MALDKDILESSILSILSSYPSTVSQAVDLWVDAYDTYASDAEDGSGDPVVLVNKPGLSAAFTTAFSQDLTNSPTAAFAASNVESGIVAYWTGAQFGITSLPTGWATKISSTIVTPPVPNEVILSVFNDNITGSTFEQKAEEIATALHSMTITGSGSMVGTLPAPSPIALPYTIS